MATTELNFGPEWIRALTDGAGIGSTNSGGGGSNNSSNSGNSGPKTFSGSSGPSSSSSNSLSMLLLIDQMIFFCFSLKFYISVINGKQFLFCFPSFFKFFLLYQIQAQLIIHLNRHHQKCSIQNQYQSIIIITI